MNSKCVWVVDDDPIFRLIFSMTLKRACGDYTVIQHENGATACEALHMGVKDDSLIPKWIFMDINMPKMNGWECLDVIRDCIEENIARLPKIFIVSSSINPEDEEKAFSYSFTTGFLTKPISVEKFQEILLS